MSSFKSWKREEEREGKTESERDCKEQDRVSACEREVKEREILKEALK